MTLIETAKLYDVEPMAWLTDLLERIVSGRTKANVLHTILPWNWQSTRPPGFAIAVIIHTTGGNFRLLGRLLSQIERILGINELQAVTAAVVEAARESLVISTA